MEKSLEKNENTHTHENIKLNFRKNWNTKAYIIYTYMLRERLPYCLSFRKELYF